MPDKTILHNPVFRVGGNDTEPSNYSLITHNHDGVYATAGHNHDGVYSPVGHTHDFSGDFAAIDHNHDGTYSLTSHNHDGVYAASDHNHDSTYAPKSHSDTTIGNPHSVTAAEVGNDTAQWNAAKLQGKTIASTAPTDGQVQTWNDTAQEWQPATPPGASGGETNTASNLGTGTGLFASKSGVDLQFNSIAAGDGISISVASNTITIASSIKNKFDATTAPTVDNDTTEGYSVGSRWIDVTNDKVYDCVDATDGAAVWNEVGAGSGGGGEDIVARRMIADNTWNDMVYREESAGSYTDGFFDTFNDSSGVDIGSSTNLNEGNGLDSYTKTLLHMDGSDSGTTFTDSSTAAKTWTANGNVNTKTAIKKFGTAAAYFDGDGDYLETPSSSDFDPGSSDFTIEAWIYPSSVSGNKTIYSGGTSDYEGIRFGLINNHIALFASSGSGWDLIVGDGASTGLGSITISANTWTHVAFVRSGARFMGYVNGILDVDYTASTAAITNTGQSRRIGVIFGSQWPFAGYIDEFKFDNGVARYTSSFTPGASPYPVFVMIEPTESTPGTPDNMTAVSQVFTSPINPTSGEVDLIVETTGTADTDWFVDILASTGNWTNAPLTLVQDYGSNIYRYRASATLTSTDSNRAYRIRTVNNTDFKCTRIMHIWE